MSDLIAAQVTPIVESFFGLDGGAMFGIIPKPLWQRTNPADELNRIKLATRCLVLSLPDGRRILVDGGMGDKWAAKDRTIYTLSHVKTPPNTLQHNPTLTDTAITDPDHPAHVEHRSSLRAGLRAAGIDPNTITDVLITHLHFDHVGGLTYIDAAGALRPTFPNATHHVQRENWVWAHHPTLRDAGSYRAENFSILGAANGPALSFTEGVTKLWDAVEVIPTRGHTPGLQMVRFFTGQETVLYVSDIIPTLGHLQLPYVMGYDLHPLITVQEKHEALENAVHRGWLIGFEHDPACAFARITKNAGDRYAAQVVDAEVK
jgi:glyoxylase-like metal-dependent hydrolase (beta-lactamase superfamily II)